MASDKMTPEKILKKVKDENIKFIDLKFLDLPGLWQHFTITPGEIGIDDPDGAKGGIWTEGIGFDGSSIRGFQEIQESDMILSSTRKPPSSTPSVSIPLSASSAMFSTRLQGNLIAGTPGTSPKRQSST